MRNCHHPDPSPSLDELSFKEAPLNFLLFLYKVILLSFFLHTCAWFAIACISCIAILLLFPNKPILLVKITGYLIFKVEMVKGDVC